MKTFQHMVTVIFKDLWGATAFMLVSTYLKCQEPPASVFHLLSREKMLPKLIEWSESNKPSGLIIFNIFFTYFFISFLISAAFTIFFIAFHIFYPYFTKIVTSLLFPVSVYIFYEVRSDMNYRPFFLTLSCVYTIYRLYKTYTYHDQLPYELAARCLNDFFDQEISFYTSLITPWILIIVDVFLIRILDIIVVSIFDHGVLMFYLVGFVYTTSYSVRGNFTIYYGSKRLPAVDKLRLIDKIYVFFSARCFGFWKAVSFIPSTLDMLYTSFIPTDPNTATILEHGRSAASDCMMNRKPFIEYKIFRKNSIWKGELRRRMKRVNLREDILPSILITLMFMYNCIRYFENEFIRMQEAFVIVFSHFFIVIEMINGYLFVEIYRSSYGIIEVSDDKASDGCTTIADEVSVSKITVSNTHSPLQIGNDRNDNQISESS